MEQLGNHFINSRTLLPVFVFNSGSVPTLIKQSMTNENKAGLFAFLPGVTDLPSPLTTSWAYMIIWRADNISRTVFFGLAVNNAGVYNISVPIPS